MPSAWDWLGWGTPAEAQEHQQEKQDNTKAGNKALQDIDRILKDMYGGLTADPTGGFGGAHGGALQAGGGGFRPGRAGRAQGEATTTTDADGTKTTTAPDGSKTITKPDGTVTTTPPAPDSEQGRAEGMPSPQVDVSGKQAVAGGAAPAGSSYNYFQRHGHPMPFEASELKSIQTPYGPVTANPQALADIKGLTDELKKAGAPIKKLGSYNPRPKRWGGGYSSHGMGAAWDIDDAESLSPAMQRWIRENPEKWAQAKERWNIGQPLPEKDAPHLEWRGPHGSKLIDDPSDANAARKRVDDKASKSIWDQPSVDLRVQFKNVPPGVKTDADADGPLINQVTVDHSKAVPKQATQ